MYNQNAREIISNVYLETQIKHLSCSKFYFYSKKIEEDFEEALSYNLLRQFEDLIEIFNDYYSLLQEDFEMFLFKTLKSITHFSATKKCKI